MNLFFIRGLSKLRLLNKLNLESSLNVNGKTFKIPILKSNGWDNLMDGERWMSEVLRKLLEQKASASFIDVGANVGQTLIKVKSIRPDIDYIGFEPNPVCVFAVEQLIEKNSIDNVKLFPVGISSSTEIRELNFYYKSDTDTAASMITDFRPEQKVYKRVFIPCFTISAFRNIIDFSRVGVIKIDVEGAELEVLNGLSECLQETRPYIIMEVLPVYKIENMERFQRQIQIQKVLLDYQYKMLRIRKNKEDGFSHFEPLNEFGIHSDMNLTNYVFYPEESSLVN